MAKKSLFVSALVLGTSFMMLSGFDSEATVDDVMSKYIEASKDAKEFNAAVTLDAKASLSTTSETSGTSTMSMGATMDMDMAYKLEPLSMAMTGNVKADALGTGVDMNMEMYAITNEEGGLDSYANVDMGSGETSGWEYSALDADDIKEVTDMITQAQNFDPSTLPFSYSLGDGAVDVDGTSCYQLLATCTYEDLKPLITEAMNAAGESTDDEDTASTLAMMDSMMAGLVVNMEIDVADDTYLPVKFHLDMDGSDFSAIGQIISYYIASSADTSDGSVTLPEVSFDVTALSMDATYDYASPVDITVPEEALLAKTTDNDSNVSSIGDLAEDIAEDVEEATTEAE